MASTVGLFLATLAIILDLNSTLAHPRSLRCRLQSSCHRRTMPSISRVDEEEIIQMSQRHFDIDKSNFESNELTREDIESFAKSVRRFLACCIGKGTKNDGNVYIMKDCNHVESSSRWKPVQQENAACSSSGISIEPCSSSGISIDPCSSSEMNQALLEDSDEDDPANSKIIKSLYEETGKPQKKKTCSYTRSSHKSSA